MSPSSEPSQHEAPLARGNVVRSRGLVKRPLDLAPYIGIVLGGPRSLQLRPSAEPAQGPGGVAADERLAVPERAAEGGNVGRAAGIAERHTHVAQKLAPAHAAQRRP